MPKNATAVLSRHAVDVVDLQVVGGRGLRLTLRRDTAGRPVELSIEPGWLTPDWRPDERRPVTVPGYLVSDLRDALATLEAAR